MTEFIALPSGIVLNLALVRRVAASEQLTLIVYFAGDDFTILNSEDAAALRKRLAGSTIASSNTRAAVFWLVILLAGFLVWLAIRR